MTQEEIKASILDIISEIVPDEDTSHLDPDVRIRDQINMDSMDFLDIIMELRKRYQVDVPEEDYPKLATLSSCATYLDPWLKDK